MEKGDLLSLSMLEAVEEEETITSPSPAEEPRSPDEDPEPQEEWPTSAHAPNCPEEASQPKEKDSQSCCLAN